MKVSYKVAMINEEWIKNCLVPDWQRNLYSSNVNRFVNLIRNGTFLPHSLITVAWLHGKKKWKVVGGQHRIEAIRITKASILCDLKVLEDATEDDLIKEYEAGNAIKAERLIDVLKLYANGYRNEELLELLDEKKFPIIVSLNGGQNSIRVDNFLNMVYNGIRPVIGREGLGRKKAIKFIEELNQEKIGLFKEFFAFYKKCFGEPDMQNWVYRTLFVATIMRIWIANKNEFKEDELIKQFRIVSESATIRQISGAIDYASIEQMTKSIYRLINKHRSINKFTQFWDEQIEIPIK